MKASRWSGNLLAVVLIWSVGCSKEERRAPVKPAEPPPATAPAPSPSIPPAAAEKSSSPGQGVGTVTGKVIFKGTQIPGKVAIGKDKEVCGDSKLDPGLVVGSQGELINAVIQFGDLKQPVSAPKEALLDQVKCEYVPHVVAISVGSSVKIKNSDGILHNVHSFSEKNTPFNRAQPKYLKEISEKFTKPEIVSLRCDVHGWMSGWIVVTESPFYEVTGADGSFKMEHVPVGKYNLEVWHETLGKAAQPVEVKFGEVTHVTFEYQMKK